jgi:DNA-directed RNA polymerase specialized sigma subunit
MNPFIALLIRDMYFIGKMKQREIGRMFGKSQGHISRVISGKVWE